MMAEEKSGNTRIMLPRGDAKMSIINFREIYHVLKNSSQTIRSLLDVSLSKQVLESFFGAVKFVLFFVMGDYDVHRYLCIIVYDFSAPLNSR